MEIKYHATTTAGQQLVAAARRHSATRSKERNENEEANDKALETHQKGKVVINHKLTFCESESCGCCNRTSAQSSQQAIYFQVRPQPYQPTTSHFRKGLPPIYSSIFELAQTTTCVCHATPGQATCLAVSLRYPITAKVRTGKPSFGFRFSCGSQESETCTSRSQIPSWVWHITIINISYLRK